MSQKKKIIIIIMLAAFSGVVKLLIDMTLMELFGGHELLIRYVTLPVAIAIVLIPFRYIYKK